MRKLFSFTVLFILIFAGSPTQAQRIAFGAKLGIGFPGFVNEEIASQRITLATGLVGSLKITDGIQLMTELGYQRKGNKFTNQVWDAKGTVIADSTYLVKTNLDYVTVQQ